MRVTVLYNKPEAARYAGAGELDAEFGVLDEVKAVSEALHEFGHTVQTVALGMPAIKARLMLERLDTDIVYNLFEGFSGHPETEADIAAYLEALSIPHTGCTAPALRLGLDKTALKEKLSSSGVAVPESMLVTDAETSLPESEFPYIVKPNRDDASHGITAESVVHSVDDLRAQIARVRERYGYDELIVERFIDGREFNATVTGNETARILGISEIVFDLPENCPNILTYKSKWDQSSDEYRGTQPVCPPAINDNERTALTGAAEKAYRAAGCCGYGRVDMRMDQHGAVYVLEVNPNPDISPDSGAARQARSAGLSYPAFIERILSLGAERIV